MNQLKKIITNKMESYLQINNKFIKNNQRMFKQKTVTPFDNQITGLPAGKTVTTKLSEMNDDLTCLFIKVNYVLNGTPTQVQEFNCLDIFDRLIIRQRSTGVEICNNSKEYQFYRAEQLKGQDISGFMKEGDIQTGSSTGTAFVPVFTWFADKKNTFLSTKTIKDLELVAIVNNELLGIKDGGGLFLDLESVNLELVSVFLNNTKTDTITRLPKSYNVYYEKLITFVADATLEYQTTLQLTCPYPCMNVIVVAVDDTNSIGNVDKITLTTNNNTFLTNHSQTNYTFYDTVNFPAYSMVTWFTQEKDRFDNVGLLTFSGSMKQTDITINLNELVETRSYTIYTFMEYRTENEVIEGRIGPNTTLEGSKLYA